LETSDSTIDCLHWIITNAIVSQIYTIINTSDNLIIWSRRWKEMGFRNCHWTYTRHKSSPDFWYYK